MSFFGIPTRNGLSLGLGSVAALQSVASAAAAVVDAFWSYVTLLLPGNGTNGAQNNTFLDASSNAFTITRNGNTTQGTFTPYGANWSNYFSANGQYLTVGTSTNLALGAGDYTVECWVFLTAYNASTSALFDWRTSGGAPAATPALGLSATGVPTWYETAPTAVITSSTAIALNTWTHFALVRSGTTVTMYLNGSSVGTATSSTNLGIQTFRINDPQSLYVVYGYISNVRIVKGTAVYTGAFTPPTAPLTAITNTQLLTCQSNRLIDNSSNAFAITVTGTPSVQRFSPFSPSAAYSTSVVGGSGYFDGSGDSLQAAAGAVPAIGSGDFQISGWWYFNQLKNYQILFDFRNGTESEAVPYIFVDVNGTATYYVNAVSRNFSTAFKAKEWTYVVVSRVGSTTKAFMNGAEVLSYTDTTTYVAGRLTLGFNNNGAAANYYDGYIAGFRSVTGSGTTSTTVPTAPPTAITGTQALLNFTNAGIIDNAMMNDLETVGNAQISTTQSKFGGSSMAFDGSGDWLSDINTATASLGAGDFTVECWLYSNLTGTQVLFSLFSGVPATTLVAEAYFQGSTIYWSTGGLDRITGSAALSTNTWQHIALCRSSGTTKLFVDGVQKGSSYVDANNYAADVLFIGGKSTQPTFSVNGYIDDLRITKGVARYTANFTPPTAAFPLQ